MPRVIELIDHRHQGLLTGEAVQADDQGEGAGQESPLQAAVVVGEALPGDGQPAQRLAHQQEGAGVLRGPAQKGGAGTVSRTAAGNSGGAAARGGGAAPLSDSGTWSRPYFLRNLYKATRETRTSKV